MNNVQAVSSAEASSRRQAQRERLIACGEAAVAAGGLAALRARDLAACAGCSVGAIYNLVADLDELTLLVAERTLRMLNLCLDRAEADAGGDDRFVVWALAYCDFAARNRNRWRALFDYRLPEGRDLPEWFVAAQFDLFKRIEDGLAIRSPDLTPKVRQVRARTLFSAVHGIVALGLEEKLVAMPVNVVKEELALFVRRFVAESTDGA